MTETEYERGYTDAQRDEARRALDPQNPPWLKVLLDPWPNRVNMNRDQKIR
jgi:hypothetical protein